MRAISSFSVRDTDEAKRFYESLGVRTRIEATGGCPPMLYLDIGEGAEVMLYPKDDHVPATFTVLNFQVENISEEARKLSRLGVRFERYEGTGENGVTHNEGPLIAWFKDPSGNFLSLIEVKPQPLGRTKPSQVIEASGNGGS